MSVIWLFNSCHGLTFCQKSYSSLYSSLWYKGRLWRYKSVFQTEATHLLLEPRAYSMIHTSCSKFFSNEWSLWLLLTHKHMDHLVPLTCALTVTWQGCSVSQRLLHLHSCWHLLSGIFSQASLKTIILRFCLNSKGPTIGLTLCTIAGYPNIVRVQCYWFFLAFSLFSKGIADYNFQFDYICAIQLDSQCVLRHHHA